jgi:hypothetical protein
MQSIWKGIARGLLAAALCASGVGWAQTSDLSGVSCPPATEEPPSTPLGVVLRRPPDYVRHWPQTWICETRIEAVANLWLPQVRQETDDRTGESRYVLEPASVPERPRSIRWQGRLTWKMLMDAQPQDSGPVTLIVRAEYEQPSLARFDMFVSLTAKGVTGTSSRVLDEGASHACLRDRNDCTHVEEVMLEIPREAMRSAMKTGLIIDLLGHGRSERLAIGKEAVWAFGERAGLR